MTWLVTGANGQLGRAFQRCLLTHKNVKFLDRSVFDLKDTAKMLGVLGRHQPSVIINCAAYTAVDAAEDNDQDAMQVNAEAVGKIAQWSSENSAFMVHFSTDYVFNGNIVQAYSETSLADPLSIYGRSKAEGEALFLSSHTKVCV